MYIGKQSLILDTGATNSCNIKGTKNGFVKSLGVSFILIGHQKLEHIFHIVDENFLIPVDEILEKDFISRYKYNSHSSKLRDPQRS